MKIICYPVLALFLAFGTSCSGDQKNTPSTTDSEAAADGSAESPAAATNSAGSSGMGGAVPIHALASDTLYSDSTNLE
ncbi:hypothetical protein [Rufibacter sp. XAAS-G3-1]|uniref:hypothetical protein n=1 Tax=Rufibacter sp. XAAS-G3-1 TaxID=2729134 RepID=UPI0015E7E1D8|nr:hypothetical protein [Rufibacter sp. XAAS-G3-1]